MNEKDEAKHNIMKLAIPSQAELLVKGLLNAEGESKAPAIIFGQPAPLTFNCPPQEIELIKLIGKRACEMAKEYGASEDFNRVCMDVAVLHCNGMPLRLRAFLHAELPLFAHDYATIAKHLDRTTGKLMNGQRLVFALNG